MELRKVDLLPEGEGREADIGYITKEGGGEAELHVTNLTGREMFRVTGEKDLVVSRDDKDDNQIFTTVSYHRTDGSLYKTSELLDGESPTYEKRVETTYKADGVTVARIREYTLAYDTDGDFLSEEITSDVENPMLP
jgi:hypothetical protein